MTATYFRGAVGRRGYLRPSCASRSSRVHLRLSTIFGTGLPTSLAISSTIRCFIVMRGFASTHFRKNASCKSSGISIVSLLFPSLMEPDVNTAVLMPQFYA